MQRGFYNLAQSIINQQRMLDTIANNVANVKTSGYKKDEVVFNTFQEELILVQNRRATSGTFLQTYVDVSKTNLEVGGYEFTDSPFDVALQGNVYFNIEAINGETLLTRQGQFELNGQGYLCLNDSGRVLGQNGPIYIGNDDFKIRDDGAVLDAENNVIDFLALSYIPPEADVTRIGDNLFRYDGDMAIPDDEKFAVIQYAFETSNVDGAKEITQAMEVQRMFEASSALLKYMDSINGQAAAEIIKL